jgi:hypothetical protein
VRLGWDKLTTVQQWMCEQALGIEPAAEKPQPRYTQADNAAAKQFYEREGHLRVPRKHVERIFGGSGTSGLEHGSATAEQGATLTPERVEHLSTIGMRWT